MMRTWAAGEFSRVRAQNWAETSRGRLLSLCQDRQDISSVQHTRLLKRQRSDTALKGMPKALEGSPIPLVDQQSYKYVISVGNNVDWTDRLRLQLSSNSASILQTGIAQEFFSPLLNPFEHFIPLLPNITDVIEAIEWAIKNDDDARTIMQNAQQFASVFLSEEGMLEYAYIALLRHSELLQYEPDAQSPADSSVVPLNMTFHLLRKRPYSPYHFIHFPDLPHASPSPRGLTTIDEAA